MPTLFRLLFVFGVVFAAGYGALYAAANLVHPQSRLIVEAVALPQGAAEVRTGRSAAETLGNQASALVRHRHHKAH